MKNKEKIILVGGGGQCMASIDVIEQTGIYEIEAIVDVPEKVGQTILYYPILYTDDQLPELSKRYKNFLVTVGQIRSSELRIKLFNILKSLEVTLPVIISPLAYVSRHATIDEGTIVMHHALVNADARVGKNCIINSKALIEHSATVGDFCHISTGAIINGDAIVGERCFVGSNAIARHGITIPANSFIKANSLVK